MGISAVHVDADRLIYLHGRMKLLVDALDARSVTTWYAELPQDLVREAPFRALMSEIEALSGVRRGLEHLMERLAVHVRHLHDYLSFVEYRYQRGEQSTYLSPPVVYRCAPLRYREPPAGYGQAQLGSDDVAQPVDGARRALEGILDDSFRYVAPSLAYAASGLEERARPRSASSSCGVARYTAQSWSGWPEEY